MALIKKVRGFYPQWGDGVFIAENATLVGDVEIGNNCSIWFNAVVRGDVNSIRIGDFSNIQDNVCIHATYEKTSTHIGSYVNVGHNAIVHGCMVHDHVLIGMGAIVMDRAAVQPYVIVGAGSVVLEGTICESGYLYAGIPARKIKPITDEQRKMLDQLPHNYVMYASWFEDK
ncbi:gamma carbonic anhydrase family protein [Olivibacter sitiensis]|uniref:gamma carbonic anhydrase family protein n=1 Tax=Olivibacter sitiensis TaxID=376470 RepID=UPI000404288E|nr:gamma carbonic anhydrase family protein [Olivibacter sitiensis]